ncbi:MAG: 4-(cytidine 5'-diphospho)-2-C-methyl-D-erythritol kinase [Desulfovibrio sp.]|nr:4-(cytidine 5'-diphospho)-2-C-methyl-D-erythritol kinase [Desulfovibrio sp.]
MNTTLHAGCKINIGLRITNKLPNGYHELDSFFYPLPEPHDTLEIVTQSHPGIAVQSSAAIDVKKNTLTRAYAALSEHKKLTGILVNLTKAIPLGAGLGGGSSDAASLLKFLNATLDNPLPEAELVNIAAEVGADVPFFLQNNAARVTGIGQHIEPASINVHDKTILLIVPNIIVSTSWAYEEYDRLHDLGHTSPKALTKTTLRIKQRLLHTEKEWSSSNDLELPVFQKYPLLARLKEELFAQGAEVAAMSGSGCTIFGIFDQNTIPDLRKFEQRGYRVYLNRILN